jgi:hypothetical protein
MVATGKKDGLPELREGKGRRPDRGTQFHCGVCCGSRMMNAKVFWIFGILQSLSLGAILFLVFRSLNGIGGQPAIGLDTRIVLSVAFPLFLLLVEYTILTRR